jgi:methionyl-tRNA formyltransferase
MKIGVLSTINNPTLPFVLASLFQHGIDDLVVLLDDRIETEKDLGIWRERTGGAFEQIEGVSLHHFYGTPFYFVGNHNSAQCAEIIWKSNVECLVNGGTPRKLNRQILDAVPHGVINVHPGVLPKYRGSCCVEWAIYNNDPVGNTAHFMIEEYDEGPIILSESYEFPKDTDYQSIRVRTYRDGFLLLGKAAAMVANDGLKPDDAIPQGEGVTWKPVDEGTMQSVVARVERGEYAYARL